MTIVASHVHAPRWFNLESHNAAAYAEYGSSCGLPIPGSKMYARGGWSPADGQAAQLQGNM